MTTIQVNNKRHGHHPGEKRDMDNIKVNKETWPPSR
jgi:hypothetical protein